MKKLMIVGAGGFGREVCCWAQQNPSHGREWRVAGFLDDRPSVDSPVSEVETVGRIADHQPSDDELFVCGVGQPKLKRRLCTGLIERGATFVRLIHPSVVMGDRVHLGEGVVLCPKVVITCDVVIGDFAMLNVGTTVGHDARVGAWSTLSAQCDVTGGATLEEEVFLGSHATVLPNHYVGRGAVVGAGTVPVLPVPAGETVFGVPGKRVTS